MSLVGITADSNQLSYKAINACIFKEFNIYFCTNLLSNSMQGLGVSTFNPKKELYPLIRGADAALNSESKESAL